MGSMDYVEKCAEVTLMKTYAEVAVEFHLHTTRKLVPSLIPEDTPLWYLLDRG
jgi:hypothetical protein